MDARPSFRPYLASAITLFLIGTGAAVATVFGLTPTVFARLLFFFGVDLVLTGLGLPVSWFLNLRFPSKPPAEVQVIVRQAIWVGVFGATLLWLQESRLASLGIGLGLAVGLGVIEYLIRMRESSRWRPAPPTESPAAGSEQQPPHA
jgi:hypothetical protein